METSEIVQIGERYLAGAGINFKELGYDITVTASKPAGLKQLVNTPIRESETVIS